MCLSAGPVFLRFLSVTAFHGMRPGGGSGLHAINKGGLHYSVFMKYPESWCGSEPPVTCFQQLLGCSIHAHSNYVM